MTGCWLVAGTFCNGQKVNLNRRVKPNVGKCQKSTSNARARAMHQQTLRGGEAESSHESY